MPGPAPTSSAGSGSDHEGLTRTPLLLVEDDDTIGRSLQAGLQAHGYRTEWATTAAAGLALAREQAYRVLLLDLGLPDLDGVEVARSLRAENPELLIVILTARTDDLDVIVGLDAGADDYLTKPFSLSVLLARLRAHLRTPPLSPEQSTLLKAAGLAVDLAARRCTFAGLEIGLRPKEFDLLAALTFCRGEAVTREALMSQVWDENWFGSTKTLDVTMASLRSRLQQASAGHTEGKGASGMPTITTLRGYGYRLEAGL